MIVIGLRKRCPYTERTGISHAGGRVLIDELIIAVRELLEHEGRVAYRMLKRRFELNDDDLEDIKAELIDAKRDCRG